MDEWVEQVDERDLVVAVVRRAEAVRRGWLHRIAVTMCRDREGRFLVHRRSGQVSRFPGHYEVAVGGAVAVGESYKAAAARELGEELGVQVPVRLVVKFLSLGGLSPHWLAIHEAVVLGRVRPDGDEVVWHDWMTRSELSGFMRRQVFTPDSQEVLSRYVAADRPVPPEEW
ncbi:NUDIX domain-containing protein [Streptomyces sp. NPDC088732]|uniref:NUDIX domain-containing protein n=1 Tax=Streptomyces sp. NPDC088732 TaxID=3365879 RepID=UPI003815D087